MKPPAWRLINMKKSTEKRRISRMTRDARQMFMHGLITSSGLDSINKILMNAHKKL